MHNCVYKIAACIGPNRIRWLGSLFGRMSCLEAVRNGIASAVIGQDLVVAVLLVDLAFSTNSVNSTRIHRFAI